jgi:acyl-coenzyme A thioesterase PaaI-like protein
MSQPPPPHAHDALGRRGEPTSTGDEPLNRLAAAIRRISGVAVGHPIPDDKIVRASEYLERIAEGLENSANVSRRARTEPNLAGHPQDFFPSSPIIGFANPIAPPVQVWLGENEEGQLEIHGRVTFDYQYEGPPTCVHGGVIAELFDELMGAANVIAEKPSMTGTLTVRYRKHTPLLTPLDLVARCLKSEGRKVHTWAAIYHQGAVTAEANGLFIEVRPGHMLDVLTTNAASTDDPVIDSALARSIAENAPD